MEAALALGMSRAMALQTRDRPPGDPDRDPAGDQRLHRALQGHIGLLGHHPGRADQAVFDPRQQHGRGDRVRPGRGRALHDDECSAVLVFPVVRAPAGLRWRERRGAAHDRSRRPGQVAWPDRSASRREPRGVTGRGRRDHRALGQRQEHVSALPERAGVVSIGQCDARRSADRRRRAVGRLGATPSRRSAAGSAWCFRASTSFRTGRRSRT